MSAPPDPSVLRIEPEPNGAELATITVAIALLHQSQAAGTAPAEMPNLSRWARAARLEAAGLADGTRDTWRPAPQSGSERTRRNLT